MKPTLFVSECLRGTRCLYHGGRATFALDVLAHLEKHFHIISACAEELGGLPTPRRPSRIRNGRVKMDSRDVTAEFERGRDIVLQLISDNTPIACALLLDKSPSCSPSFGCLGTALVTAGIPCIGAQRGNRWEERLTSILSPQEFTKLPLSFIS